MHTLLGIHQQQHASGTGRVMISSGTCLVQQSRGLQPGAGALPERGGEGVGRVAHERSARPGNRQRTVQASKKQRGHASGAVCCLFLLNSVMIARVHVVSESPAVVFQPYVSRIMAA